MVLHLAWQPRLKLNARHLLALAVEVGQILRLLYCVRNLCRLFGAFIFWQHVEVVLKHIDRFVGLEGCTKRDGYLVRPRDRPAPETAANPSFRPPSVGKWIRRRSACTC